MADEARTGPGQEAFERYQAMKREPPASRARDLQGPEAAEALREAMAIIRTNPDAGVPELRERLSHLPATQCG
jgi:hypothetical protein